eukprot:33820_1
MGHCLSAENPSIHCRAASLSKRDPELERCIRNGDTDLPTDDIKYNKTEIRAKLTMTQSYGNNIWNYWHSRRVWKNVDGLTKMSTQQICQMQAKNKNYYHPSWGFQGSDLNNIQGMQYKELKQIVVNEKKKTINKFNSYGNVEIFNNLTMKCAVIYYDRNDTIAHLMVRYKNKCGCCIGSSRLEVMNKHQRLSFSDRIEELNFNSHTKLKLYVGYGCKAYEICHM